MDDTWGRENNAAQGQERRQGCVLSGKPGQNRGRDKVRAMGEYNGPYRTSVV